MSKRTGALSVRSFRDQGADPLALAVVAVLTGTGEAVRPVVSLDELAALADLSKISRALTKFDPEEIGHLSARMLHAKPFSAVATGLAVMGISGPDAEAFWLAVRANLQVLGDAASWWKIIHDTAPIPSGDAGFLGTALGCLPPAPWDEATWGNWTKAVSAATGAKGRALFMPLRMALTGLEHGPELKALLPLIGYGTVVKRLGG